jgi:hypothetical protein
LPRTPPKPGDLLAVVATGVTLKNRVLTAANTIFPSNLIAKRLSLVAGRQLNSALARVALLTVCEGGEPSVNAICA